MSTATQQIKGDIEKKVQSLGKAQQDEYLKIIVAGMKFLYSPQTQKYEQAAMAKIKGPQDIPPVVADGIMRLMALIYQESGKKMSIPASIPAATVLACNVLEDIEKGKRIQITDEVVAQTTAAVVKALYKRYNIQPQQVNQVVQQGHQMLQQQKGAQPPGAQPVPAPPAQGAA